MISCEKINIKNIKAFFVQRKTESIRQIMSLAFSGFFYVKELLHAFLLAYCRNLMAKQDMSELGFGKEGAMEASDENVNERIDN
jgi:hypothetical protein